MRRTRPARNRTQGAVSNYKNLPLAAREPAGHGIGRSRGGLSTKIHAGVDGHGRPLALVSPAGSVTTGRRWRRCWPTSGSPVFTGAGRGPVPKRSSPAGRTRPPPTARCCTSAESRGSARRGARCARDRHRQCGKPCRRVSCLGASHRLCPEIASATAVISQQTCPKLGRNYSPLPRQLPTTSPMLRTRATPWVRSPAT